jgi:hypothetical protein
MIDRLGDIAGIDEHHCLNVPHPLQNLNRFGLPENSVVAELVAERLAALVLLGWDLLSRPINENGLAYRQRLRNRNPPRSS